MSHKSQRMVTIRIDDASGALTDISGDVDTWSLARTVEALETTAVGDADRAYLPGLHGGALTLGGPFNDTAPQTDAILAGALGSSVTRTVEVGIDGARFYRFEALVQRYVLGGAPPGLVTWEATLQITGAVNRTSAAL
ncbi:MAG: hypothetical protein Kow00120_20570 [Anaerolineae bacterium]